MCSVQQLRDFIRERLTAAAEEIFTQVAKTIISYEEEIKVLETCRNEAQIKTTGTAVPKQQEDEEDEVLTGSRLCSHMMSLNENQEESEPPQDGDSNQELGHQLLKEEPEAPGVKEERQEVCCSQEGQSLHFTQTLQQTEFSEEEANIEHLDSNNVSALENQDEAGSCSPVLASWAESVPDKSCECRVCGKAFKSQYNMLRHLREHSGEKPLRCKICGKVFVQTCHLKEHLQMHTGVKPFSCETCGKSFTRKSSLKVHRKAHTGDKPYSCETCGKRFSRSFCLKVHRKTHTGVKPFSCEICGKSFREKWYLKFHIKTHTVEQPYSCQACDESFNSMNELVCHQKVHKPVRGFW
ncbi:zinc finger protein 436-like [Poeciliopsis prolifica]|uniref:zinc finger protein 436-like n=1 Tax=Poeciliopsis prolifica TaxID=188132 RepID=UPI00241458E3|nr:zinc finger protein 436-like [Poeciliopsis prolifica]